jgi:hypothetical protein
MGNELRRYGRLGIEASGVANFWIERERRHDIALALVNLGLGLEIALIERNLSGKR